ncbi:MAG: tetratricopeptide repeat protein [Defluviitaleaceae bacterium]|nr:tetratricopeptide repeat protein [Defluviitaleaceae bacterium]
MDNWTILNISPTDDREAIKRAYMMLLPKHNPEDDPEGFSRLRNAYEQVLKELDLKQKEAKEETPLTLFLQRLEQLYTDFERRCNVNEWRELLKDEACMRLDLEDSTSEHILVFFMTHSYLPKDVWILLNNHFDWPAKKSALKKVFPPNFIEFIISSGQYESLNYSLFTIDPNFLGEVNSAQYDTWIRLYYAIESLVQMPENTELITMMQEMESMPIRHIYYDLLKAYMHTYKGEPEYALAIAQPIIEKIPMDSRAGYIYAQILLSASKTKDAFYHFEALLKNNPQDLVVKKGLVEALLELNEFEEARTHLLDILDEFPYNPFAMHTFRLVTDNLIRAYEKKYKKCDFKNKSEESLEIALTLAKHYLNGYEYTKCLEILTNIPNRDFNDYPRYYEYLADCYQATGNFEKAIELYEKNVTLEKKYRNHVKYITVLIETNQAPKALKCVEEALRIKDTDRLSFAYLHDSKGLIMHQLERYAEALLSYDNALEINDQASHIYIHKARTLQAMYRYSDAIECSEFAILVFPYITEAYTIQMEIYYEEKCFDQMLELSNRVDKSGFDSPRIKYYKACALHMLNKLKEAGELLQTLIANEFDEGYKDFFYEEAAYLALTNLDYESALYNIEKAIKINGNYTYRHVLLGDILSHNKKYADALMVYDNILEKEPDNLPALLGRGTIYYDQENYPLAEKDLKIVVNANEFNNSENNMKLGIIYHRLGRHQESLDHLLKVVSLNEKLADNSSKAYLYTLIGIKYSGNFNDVKNAIKFYELAHGQDHNYDPAIRRMGDMHLYHYKDYQTAIECYDKVIALNPIDPFGYALKGYVLKKIKNKYNFKANNYFKKALSLLNEKIKNGDTNLDSRICTAFCYIGLKKYKLAHRIYMDILVGRDQIKWGECYFGLGLICEEKKKYKEALEFYEQALKIDNSVRNNAALEELSKYNF